MYIKVYKKLADSMFYQLGSHFHFGRLLFLHKILKKLKKLGYIFTPFKKVLKLRVNKMKPDEYKKKKNLKYKKKHPQAAINISEKTNKVSDQQPQTNQIDNHTKNFQNRKIFSNWKYYEGLEESLEEKTEIFGLDFGKAINKIGHGGEQFTVYTDGTWLSEAETGCDDSSVQASKYLTLDVDLLASNLMSIPLNERLKLENELFDEDTLASFHHDSLKHETIDDLPISDLNERPGINDLMDLLQSERTDAEPNETSNKKDNINDYKEEDLLNDLLTDTTSIKTSKPHIQSKREDSKATKALTEDIELDDLLDPDQNEQSAKVTKSRAIKDSSTFVGDIDEWLDSVLDD